MTDTLAKLLTGYGQCSWCDEDAVYSVASDGWFDYACGHHARRYWPNLFVSLAKECDAGHQCTGPAITRWVIVNDRTGELEGATACATGAHIIQEAANAHWVMPRTEFQLNIREWNTPDPCPQGYNEAACDAFCGPGDHNR
jgi:hypothetical protein